MTPRRFQRLQERIIDAIKSDSGAPDKALAAVIGCSRPHISDLRAGKRRLKLDELADLVEEYGAAVVLAPLAELDGARVVSEDADDDTSEVSTRDVLALEVGQSAISHGHLAALDPASEDGADLGPEELRAQLAKAEAQIDALSEYRARLGAQLRLKVCG